MKREVIWENTNKMLFKGFCGIKTGITSEAGPCLVSLYKKEINIMIVLLCSKSVEERWSETNRILEWAKEKIKFN